MNIATRKEIIQSAKSRGEKIAAVLPIHCPRELLRAFKIHPVEVWSPPQMNHKGGDFHFQSYTCSIVRNATSFLLGKGLENVDLLFFPHTCDSLQGMASVWRDFIKPKQKIITLYLPRGKRPSDEHFLVAELRKTYQELVDFTGFLPADSELNEQISKEEDIDEWITSLYQNRDSSSLSDREFYSTIRAREYLPPENLIAMFKSLPKGKNNSQSIRLLISGIVPEPRKIFDHINQKGAQIVGDDLACCSRRIYAKMSDNDPFKKMAKRILGAPPCSTRGESIASRIDYLKDKIKATKAQGLIIYDPKFCEPELFDVPLIRKELQKEGFPVLHLETERSDSLPQQALNRIEAFIEMLR